MPTSTRSSQQGQVLVLFTLALTALVLGAADAGSAAKLQHNIKSLIGVTTDVQIVPLSTIERSIGKAKRVVDKRAK